MLVRPYIQLKRGVLESVVSEGNRLLECAFGVTKPQVAITA